MDAELRLGSVVVLYTFGGLASFMVSDGGFEGKKVGNAATKHNFLPSARTVFSPRALEGGSGGGRRGRKFRSADGGGGAAAAERPRLPSASSGP